MKLFIRKQKNVKRLAHLDAMINLLNCRNYRLKHKKEDMLEQYEHNKMLLNAIKKNKQKIKDQEKGLNL